MEEKKIIKADSMNPSALKQFLKGFTKIEPEVKECAEPPTKKELGEFEGLSAGKPNSAFTIYGTKVTIKECTQEDLNIEDTDEIRCSKCRFNKNDLPVQFCYNAKCTAAQRCDGKDVYYEEI